MPALNPGTTAPDFSLEGTDGKTYSLQKEQKAHLVVAAFYKSNCPICQLAFPFLERIHQAYHSSNLEMLGIAQNEPQEADQFAADYELTFPMLVDDHPYAISSKYELTNVPSIFLIDPDGKILQTLVGFDKKGLIELSKKIAARTGKPVFPVFTKADNVPDFKPG